MKAVLVGSFEKKENDNKTNILTTTGQKINEQTGGKLLEQLNVAGHLKHCKSRVFYNLHANYPLIVVVGLGPQDAGYNAQEDINEAKENIRAGIGSGVNAISDLDANVDQVEIDSCGNATCAAEGAHLASYVFDEYKEEPLKAKKFLLRLSQIDGPSNEDWQRGVVLAELQNKCRNLMEQPANRLTPTIFAEEAKKLCEPLGINVVVHDKEWAEKMKMGSFLSVAQGSSQPCRFVELHYKNSGDERKPLVFVGKGITFDSGGTSLKPSSNMDEMRADMGGAANVLTTIACLAKLKKKVNVIGLIPLTENLISGSATKPGDVVFAMNGKSIQINNTDAEGRLVLADGICYADTFKPSLVIDVATLTGAMIISIGGTASGVFATNNDHFEMLRKAGVETSDRVWRFPFWKAFTKKTTDSQLADLVNLSKEPSWGGGSCIAAAFLKEFVGPNTPEFMHIDIASTMINKGDYSYMKNGMSGRPLRTLVHFVENYFA